MHRLLIALTALLAGCTQTFDDLCPRVDDHVLAAYRFDEGSGPLFTNVAPTSIEEARYVRPAVTWVPEGPCGGGVNVPLTATFLGSPPPPEAYTDPYIGIRPDPQFRINEGAIDMWLWFDPLSGPDERAQGIVARAASGTGIGHFTVVRGFDGVGDRIIVTLDGLATANPGFCSAERIEPERWHHLGVNFGGGLPLEVVVDGVPLTRVTEGDGPLFDQYNCGIDMPADISGNDEPWALGALTDRSTPLIFDQVDSGLGGSIATFRISTKRRNFTTR